MDQHPSASTPTGQSPSSPYHQVSFTGVVDSSGLSGTTPTTAVDLPPSSSSAAASSSSSPSPSAPPPSGAPSSTATGQEGGGLVYSTSSSASSPPPSSAAYELPKEGIFKDGSPYVSTTTQQPVDPTAVQIAAIGQQQALYGPLGLPYNINMVASSSSSQPPQRTLAGGMYGASSSSAFASPSALGGGALDFSPGGAGVVEGIPISNSFYTGPPPSSSMASGLHPPAFATASSPLLGSTTSLPGPCYYDPYGMINPAACITPLPLAKDDPKKLKAATSKKQKRGWCC